MTVERDADKLRSSTAAEVCSFGNFSIGIHRPSLPSIVFPSFLSLGYCCISSHSMTHTHTNTLGRGPLDEWSARRRDLYLTTRNTHNRKTSMLVAGFEPAIPASERTQTHARDRAAIGINHGVFSSWNKSGLKKIWKQIEVNLTQNCANMIRLDKPRGMRAN